MKNKTLTSLSLPQTLTSYYMKSFRHFTSEHLLLSQAHCHLFLVDNFNKAVESVQCEEETRRILRTLMQLYALDGILRNKGEFIEVGHLTGVYQMTYALRIWTFLHLINHTQ